MARLAVYTCGMLRGGAGSEQVAGFFQSAPTVFASASAAEGCLAHMMDEERGWPPSEQDWGVWGAYAVPHFFADVPDHLRERVSATLSVWMDVDAVRGFAYRGVHAAALKQRADWFEPSKFPQYVMWWIGDDETPSWSEGARRVEGLHLDGPTPRAFNFSAIFMPE